MFSHKLCLRLYLHVRHENYTPQKYYVSLNDTKLPLIK